MKKPTRLKNMEALTRHEEELARAVAERWGNLPAAAIVEKLCAAGVVNLKQCKVLAIRRRVDEAVRNGSRKVIAMQRAAEHFCTTYEYVRNCVYYHTDVNI